MANAADVNQQKYNSPQVKGVTPSVESSVGEQIRVDYFWKKALIEAARDQVFTPLASVKDMPKNMGKKIKKYHWLPILDDGNLNTQGIDSKGAAQIATDKGRLYGSSHDIGTIVAALPKLTEVGGRVNRVGYTRKVIEGTLEQFGFFSDFTKETLDFDSEAEVYDHMSRETIVAANQITETQIQLDLLKVAGSLEYVAGVPAAMPTAGGAVAAPASGIPTGASKALAGAATTTDPAGAVGVVTYADLVTVSQHLVKNRTPKQTEYITGSRMIDTRTVAGGFIMYVGPALGVTLRKMTDFFGNEAFVAVQHYAAGTTPMKGEIGSIGDFRIIEVLDMLESEGAAAPAAGSTGKVLLGAGGTKVMSCPMLIVGAESFTTIGFNTDGKNFKFEMQAKMPGSGTADRTDPYGLSGFMSIRWYYGFMAMRPERIATIWTAALK